MRVLSDPDTSDTLFSDVYPVIQRYAVNEPLLPNLTTLHVREIEESLFPYISLFLSPTITSVSFGFSELPESVVASMITSLPTSCPNLQDIDLPSLPRDPMITAAVSSMFLATNRNAPRGFCVGSPLTEEASEAVYKSQNLRNLSVVIEKGTSIRFASLPNLTCLDIECDDGNDGLQLLRGATFGKLRTVTFRLDSWPIDDFLEAFKEAALSSSIQNTLSVFHLLTEWPWNPNYSSLLPFTQLVDLNIQSSCDDSCSRVDDNVVINLSQAMPKLETLILGNEPCYAFTGGVTVKGFMALAYNCPDLSHLCVHFQVASLSDTPTAFERTRKAGYSAPWTGCALKELVVGETLVAEESVSTAALTLLRIFPRIETIIHPNEGWDKVEDLIWRSRQIVDCSGK